MEGGNARRMLPKAIQQGRRERRGEAHAVLYVEPLIDARTMLVEFFSILLRENTSHVETPLVPPLS
jgi:hypothetical protein